MDYKMTNPRIAQSASICRQLALHAINCGCCCFSLLCRNTVRSPISCSGQLGAARDMIGCDLWTAAPEPDVVISLSIPKPKRFLIQHFLAVCNPVYDVFKPCLQVAYFYRLSNGRRRSKGKSRKGRCWQKESTEHDAPLRAIGTSDDVAY